MNKQTITFTASEQTLTKTGGIEHYASNIVSYIEASFTLGDNWAGYDSIRAVWESGYARIATVLDANNKCIVPAEVLTYKSKVNVNLVGSIVENTVLTDRLTTYPILALTVDADARVDSSETTPVTASQFEQFVDVVRDEASAIQNYTYDSEAWAVGQRAGVDVPSTDETYQNNAKYYADQGATLQQEVTNLKSDFNAISEDHENMIDLANLQIGKNWLNQSAIGRAILYVAVKPSTKYHIVFPPNNNFLTIQAIQKELITSGSQLKYTAIPNGGTIDITTEATARVICIQWGKGSIEITDDMFEDYVPYLCIGETTAESAIDRSARNLINGIGSQNTNLIDMDDLQIGKNWLNQSVVGRAILYIPVEPSATYYFEFPNNPFFSTLQAIQKPSSSSGSSLKDTAIPNGGTLTLTTEATAGVICIQWGRGTLDIIPSMFSNYDPYVGKGKYRYSAIDRSVRPWYGKRLVWLGTSIPAAGKYDIDNPKSYPIMVGDLLGATVYNEAVGSSALHCKDPARINANNPYGFLDNFEAVSRCITNSSEEMEWIIEHFNDANVFTVNVPVSLSNDDKDFIRSCSWEVKLQKYFNASDFPDAWIIDHGHNDIPSVASEATYTAKESISGTQHNGYYSDGNFVSSTLSSYMEYDVTDEIYVWISGTFGAWYDVYDIYDSNGNNIGHTRNPVQTEVNSLKVNVANATTLRVSDINTQLSTINVEKLKYPTYESLYSYNGAFDFIVNKILTYNPRARIIMIGEYENQKFPTISENQLIASQRWEFPLYKQWENLGWSQQPILVNGEYKSMLNIIIPDNLHPHTDTTGYALHQMANNIAMWLNTIA